MNTFDTFRLYTFDINQSSADITRLLLIRRFPWAKIHIEENAGENTLLGPDVVIFTLVPWIFLWAPETPFMHVIRFTNHRLLELKPGYSDALERKHRTPSRLLKELHQLKETSRTTLLYAVLHFCWSRTMTTTKIHAKMHFSKMHFSKIDQT